MSRRDTAVLIGVGVVAALVVAWLGKRAGDAVGGVFSGNNALTVGTPYEDWGLIGTMGGAANVMSGGAMQSFGEWLGGNIYEITH